jgi:hypothetical protein
MNTQPTLKYPIHFEVSKYGLYDIITLTSKGDFRTTTGMAAEKPKRFRSYKQAKAAAKRHNASLIVYWLEEGEREYNRVTLYGPCLNTDHARYLPDIVRAWLP